MCGEVAVGGYRWRAQAGVQEAGERQRHGVQAVNADAAAGQGADRPAVAEVDPDVAAATPDDEVARVAVVAADPVMPAIRGIERVGRSAAERGGVPVVAPTKGEQHEARTVEPARASCAVHVAVAELAAGDGDQPCRAGPPLAGAGGDHGGGRGRDDGRRGCRLDRRRRRRGIDRGRIDRHWLGREDRGGGGDGGEGGDRDRDRDEGAGEATSVDQRCSFLPTRHAWADGGGWGPLLGAGDQGGMPIEHPVIGRIDGVARGGAGLPKTRGHRTARRSGGSSVSGPVCVRMAARDCISDRRSAGSPHSGWGDPFGGRRTSIERYRPDAPRTGPPTPNGDCPRSADPRYSPARPSVRRQDPKPKSHRSFARSCVLASLAIRRLLAPSPSIRPMTGCSIGMPP